MARCASILVALWLALLSPGLAVAAASGTELALAAYGYTAREADSSGLAYYRSRYYDAAVGQYTQRDSLGLSAAVNDYAYVAANPVNTLDPSGMEPADPEALFMQALQQLQPARQEATQEFLARARQAPAPTRLQQWGQWAMLGASALSNPLAAALGLGGGLALDAVFGSRAADARLAIGEILPVFLLHRGDLRRPSMIFPRGFDANVDNLPMTQVLLADTRLAVPMISTSVDANIAADYALGAARQAGADYGYFYGIDATRITRLINLTEYHLQKSGSVEHFIAVNREFLVERVPADAIIWGRSVSAANALWGPLLLNPYRWR